MRGKRLPGAQSDLRFNFVRRTQEGKHHEDRFGLTRHAGSAVRLYQQQQSAGAAENHHGCGAAE
jgi:hypothetical protein